MLGCDARRLLLLHAMHLLCDFVCSCYGFIIVVILFVLWTVGFQSDRTVTMTEQK